MIVSKKSLSRLWIVRINAAARQNGLSYSKLMFQLKEAKLSLTAECLQTLLNDRLHLRLWSKRRVRTPSFYKRILDDGNITKADIVERVYLSSLENVEEGIRRRR